MRCPQCGHLFGGSSLPLSLLPQFLILFIRGVLSSRPDRVQPPGTRSTRSGKGVQARRAARDELSHDLTLMLPLLKPIHLGGQRSHLLRDSHELASIDIHQLPPSVHAGSPALKPGIARGRLVAGATRLAVHVIVRPGDHAASLFGARYDAETARTPEPIQ